PAELGPVHARASVQARGRAGPYRRIFLEEELHRHAHVLDQLGIRGLAVLALLFVAHAHPGEVLEVLEDLAGNSGAGSIALLPGSFGQGETLAEGAAPAREAPGAEVERIIVVGQKRAEAHVGIVQPPAG